MHRGQLPAFSCRHHRVDVPERTSGRNAYPKRDHPIDHHVAAPPRRGTSTETRPGARAHTPTANQAHAPPGPTKDLPITTT
jgi:hypothetical protein